MPEWHCRLAAASTVPERCEGLRHRTCGLRYLPGEYSLSRGGITLPGIGTVRMPGAAFAPKGAPVTVYQDDEGWVAEFEREGAGMSMDRRDWAEAVAVGGATGLLVWWLLLAAHLPRWAGALATVGIIWAAMGVSRLLVWRRKRRRQRQREAAG